MSLQWRVHVDGLPSGQPAWPARVSIPLPRQSPARAFRVRRPDGSVVPAQARTLVPWSDGSPRWVQLDFAANAAGEHTVLPGPCRSAVRQPLKIRKARSLTTVTVGDLKVEFDPRTEGVVRRIAWRGRDLASGSKAFAFRVTDEASRVFTLAPAKSRNLIVEASGPQRYQVSWETEHADEAGSRLLDVRFRMEFLAGVEGFALTYHFFHKLPGRDFLRLRSIEARFEFAGMLGARGRGVVVQQAHGVLNMRRVVRTRNTVPILLDRTRFAPYVESLASIDDDTVYPHFFHGTVNNMGPVAALEDASAAVIVALRDFESMRPKTLTVQPGSVAYGVWPERAGLLALPQGRSSAQRFSFLFTGPGAERLDAQIEMPHACYLEPATAWLDAADSAHAGGSWDAPRLFTGAEPGAAIFSSVLVEATQRYQTSAEMFHRGDSPHMGYTTTYASMGRRRLDGQPPREVPLQADGWTHVDMIPPQSLEPVWINNEYDAMYCLALETLRTRSAANLAKLRAVARHQVEVDFVHYSDYWQQHRGSPCHTYDHNACSTAYPSHQWTQGLYYYYCISGDDDVPEVVRGICDYNIAWLARPELEINHYFNREMGWAGIALVFGYELTGEDKYRRAAEGVLRELMGCANREDFEDAAKRCASLRGSNAKLLGAAFAINTVPMAVRVYHQATGEDWAKDILLEWVAIGFANYNNKATGPKLVDMFPECFTYACELTGDTRYLRESLWQLTLFMLGIGSIWKGSGPIDGKLYGRMYRGLVHNLSACAKAGLLAQVEKRLLGE